MNSSIKFERIRPGSANDGIRQCSIATHSAAAVAKLTAPLRIELGFTFPSALPGRASVNMGSREMSLYLCQECSETISKLLEPTKETLTP